MAFPETKIPPPNAPTPAPDSAATQDTRKPKEDPPRLEDDKRIERFPER